MIEKVREKRGGERNKTKKEEKKYQKAKGQMQKEAEKGKKNEGKKREWQKVIDRRGEKSARTVTNKSLQHDRRLLKHFISLQHNSVLLPIICSVSARVDIK